MKRASVSVLIALAVGCSSGSDEADTADSASTEASTPAATDIGGEVAGGSRLVGPDIYEPILREVIAIANDQPVDAASNRVRLVLDGFEPLVQQAINTGSASDDGLVFVSVEPVGEGTSDAYVFSCGNGGQLTLDVTNEPASIGGPYITGMTSDGACTVGDRTYDGAADLGLARAPIRASETASFDRFSMARADGDSMLIDGRYLDTLPGANVPSAERGWQDATLVVVDGGETTRIEGYTSQRTSFAPLPGQAGELSADAVVDFTVTAPWTSDERIDVAVDLSHIAATASSNGLTLEPGQWSSGMLRLVAPDGSGLTVSPATGDPTTFSIAFDGDEGNGDTAPIERAWADGFQVTCPAPFDCR